MIPAVRVRGAFKKREHASATREMLDCLGGVIEPAPEGGYCVLIRTYRPEALLRFVRMSFSHLDFELVEGGKQ